MIIKDEDKHYWLYAKGWYETDHYIKDLFKIHRHWCGTEFDDNEGVLVWKCKCILFDIMLHGELSKEDFFHDLLTRLHPSNFWQLSGEKMYSYDEAMIKITLKMMRYIKIDNLQPDIDCDKNILPLNKNA